MGFIRGLISYIFIAWIYGKIGDSYPQMKSPAMWWLWMSLIPIAFVIMFKVHLNGFLKTLKNAACCYTIFAGTVLLLADSVFLLRPDIWFLFIIGVVASPFIIIFILKLMGNYMLYYNAGYDFIRHSNNKD
jgi:hypothetical protein